MPTSPHESAAPHRGSQDRVDEGGRMPPMPPTSAPFNPPPLPLSFLPRRYPVPIVAGQHHGSTGHAQPYRFPNGRPYYPSLYPFFHHPAQVYNGGDPAQFQQQWGHVHGPIAPHTPVQVAITSPAPAPVPAQGRGPTADNTQHRTEVNQAGGARPGRRHPNTQLTDGGEYSPLRR